MPKGRKRGVLYGTRVAAPSVRFVQMHSRPAGRCPNNFSLDPPLAAVVVVANHMENRHKR